MTSAVKKLPEIPVIERVLGEVASWPGVGLETGLMAGSTEFYHRGRLLGSIYPVRGGAPALDLILPPAMGEALIAQRRAQRHAMVPSPGWVAIVLDCAAAVDTAMALLRDNFERQGRPLRLV